jgi:predicted kinase
MRQNFILIRGLPGSGKSTIAKSIANHEHFETDAYFVKDGTYQFDITKLKEAHEWTQVQVWKALLEGKSVIVSNTFTKKWEVEPYLKMAESLKIVPTIITATGNYQNIHNVPEDIIQRMKDRWEEF